MDLKDKIIGMALAALIALVGWNLHETWSMKEQVFKLQQGQVILSKQIKKNSTFVKQKLFPSPSRHEKYLECHELFKEVYKGLIPSFEKLDDLYKKQVYNKIEIIENESEILALKFKL